MWVGGAATVLLLTLAYPPFWVWPAIFVALAPLSLAVVRRRMKLRHLGVVYLAGFLFFAINLLWLTPVTVRGYLALCAFIALYFPAYAFALERLVNQMRMPAWLAVPLVWMPLEFLRAGYPEGGFSWFLLGESLAPATWLTQAADLLGVWGVTFLVGMVNGLWVDLLRLELHKGRLSAVQWRRLSVVGATVCAWIGYGLFRLSQHATHPGPRVAVIQENIPQSQKDAGDQNDIFLRHLALVEQAMAATPKPDLVAWPETMVPGHVNAEFLNAGSAALAQLTGAEDLKGWLGERDWSRQALELLQSKTDDSGVAQLLGVSALAPRGNLDGSEKQNVTALMMPGKGVTQEYAKVHLVPFGEFLPWRTVPVIGRWMLALSPYGYDFSCTPGSAWTRFRLDAGGGQYTFGTPICFEDAMPQPARMMTSPRTGGGRKTDFLINVSNDGWFHWSAPEGPGGGAAIGRAIVDAYRSVWDSAEVDQRLEASQLRAVENRVPIARSVNTGDSGFVDSSGRVMALVRGANGQSDGAVGTLAMTLPLDSRVTLYDLVGDVFPVACGIVAVLAVGWTIVRPRRGIKPESEATV
ncbi:MAG TPA: apolipoprotein N-acyltransferase [Phycisphaerae bacterium]|nr:apolipoprotein N-acyltransferase [Phycisphaerae bacterium]